MIELTDAELNSPLWLKLTKHWGEELAALRMKNDSDMDELKTAFVRGRIQQIKRDLDIGADKTELEVD